ncbi:MULTISPECIES: hypothetical protein [Paraburkholderia]|uniref:Uncharacterized protein n=1 Tax=Paraburkholderia madseniana TaxID=2599607 RepID=A0AAP5BF29_9BURK|nr:MULTISPECIES: hypothetical protein [Paraburkholderia]MCX4146914.1 hypothetical protein [Paraburkholderia madseniana]MDN7149859.1 hypothetical protein [Paraburkholderia sp. WS6]MDQ6408739.1 hypothetical protein [Paraburkholderia madseniana]
MPFVRVRKPDNFARWAQIAAAISSGGGILIAGVSVGVGIHQFSQTQREAEFARFEEAQKLHETQAIEARRPYLEQKLKWCTEAIEKAAAIAADANQAKPETKTRFWQLYYGVMAMIENKELEKAMVAFGNAMDTGQVKQLQKLSLHISYACRDEMAKEWSPAWSR